MISGIVAVGVALTQSRPASTVALALSDGTPVEFNKITSKDNIQVRVPTSHDLGDDPLRIFRRDGTHYKDDANGLTLVATAIDATATAAVPTAAPAPAAAPSTTASNDNTVYTVDGQVIWGATARILTDLLERLGSAID